MAHVARHVDERIIGADLIAFHLGSRADAEDVQNVLRRVFAFKCFQFFQQPLHAFAFCLVRLLAQLLKNLLQALHLLFRLCLV